MSCAREQRTLPRREENILEICASIYATVVLLIITTRVIAAYSHLARLSMEDLNQAQSDAIYGAFSVETLDAAVVQQTAIIDRLAASAITFTQVALMIRIQKIEAFISLLRLANGWNERYSRDYVKWWFRKIEKCRTHLGLASKISKTIKDLRESLEARAEFQRSEIEGHHSEDDENFEDEDEDEESGEDDDESMEKDEETEGDHENVEMAADG